MIDLTPLDVRKKRGDFRRNLRGYDPEEVDTFLDLVAERFEELVKENLSNAETLQRMEAQLRALEGREKAVQDALVTAQKLREDVQDQSRREAESLRTNAAREVQLLKAEAEAEITRHLRDAEAMIQDRHRALEELERGRRKFLKAFRSLLERELDAVEVEEAREPLEEAPLELEFRGWTPTSEAFFIPTGPPEGAGTPADEAAGAATDEAAGTTPDGSPGAGAEDSPAGGPETPPVPRTVDVSELLGDADEGPDDAEADPVEAAETGFREGEGPEPKWLFSLLKDEERKRSEGGQE